MTPLRGSSLRPEAGKTYCQPQERGARVFQTDAVGKVNVPASGGEVGFVPGAHGLEMRDEARGPVEAGEDGLDVGRSQDDGKTHRAAGADDGAEGVERAAEDVAVEKEQGREGLVLGGGGGLLLHREVGEEGVDLGLAHLVRMALAVEEDVPAGPRDVGLLGPQAVVPRAEGGAEAVEKAGFVHPSLRPRRVTPQPPYFACAFARRIVSSGETSSTWVPNAHWWPKGSVSIPIRSP